VSVAYTDAAVGIYELDPGGGWRQIERRMPYSRDFDADLLLFDNYIPFNTLLIDRTLFDTVGPFDTDLEFFEDWDLLIRLSETTSFHHLRQVTCEYRHFRSGGHQILGEQASTRLDFVDVKARIIERHRERFAPEVIARAVTRIRDEAVRWAEEAAGRSAEADDLRALHAELQYAYHALNGELEALREHADTLEQEQRRLQERERDLREVTEEQDLHLKRLYGEIERLNGLIDDMQRTRAWRLHKAVERIRGRS
jgi:hypothetical protein